MKKLLFISLLLANISCSVFKSSTISAVNTPVVAKIDLNNVKEDKVVVEILPGKTESNEVTFHFPKTIPGTYSVNNYGQLVDNFSAYDKKGHPLTIERKNVNTWIIKDSQNLFKIQYQINDTYDVEGENGIFSPAGINILKDENFMLNMHGVIGYIKGQEERSYEIEISRPFHLHSTTALKLVGTVELSDDLRKDLFDVPRYFEIIDNPIMYSSAQPITFRVGDMDVILGVYSPNDKHKAEDLELNLKEMIIAQKEFLGEIDNTGRYAILLYLGDKDKIDAKGSGALEHHTSTVVVFPETMGSENLNEGITDVVSHEFFHILTPLNIHSYEIHNFDYINPKMSQHLWLYEGVTEYFAHLFQIHQDLIDEEEFFNRLSEKLNVSTNYHIDISFAEMSRRILEEEYQDDFYNVYHKGALIAMALDIQLRELSNGENNLLYLMQALSHKYGKHRPFKDEELIEEIVQMTHPGIQEFFDLYVTGIHPLPYEGIFKKVGLKLTEKEISTSFFHKNGTPYIDLDHETGEIFFRRNIRFNSFLNSLGVEAGDVLKSINGKNATAETIGGLIRESILWPSGKNVLITIMRNGQEKNLRGETIPPTERIYELAEDPFSRTEAAIQLRKNWLKS